MLITRRTVVLWVVALVTAAQCVFTGGCRSTEAFTLIVLPDTQNYADTRIGYAAAHWGNGDLRDRFFAQTRWIVENKERLNIVMVAHVGDIVQTDYEPEWEIANEALAVLDGQVPYILCLGNHDMGHAPGPGATGQSAVSRDTKFNDCFGPARFAGFPWYGGHMGTTNNNSFCLFEAGGMEFLILSLEFKPTDAMLAWADGVLERYPERRCIVLTHSYLRGNERIGADNYGVQGHNGRALWERFVSRHENIFLVLCGHTNVGRLSSRGPHGNEVHEVLSDYQGQHNGGDGYLRIMTFVPRVDRIDVTTYSPTRDEHLRTPENEFSLPYAMP